LIRVNNFVLYYIIFVRERHLIYFKLRQGLCLITKNSSNPRARVARWIYFKTKKTHFAYILEGLAMKDVGMNSLWTFGIFYGHSVYLIVLKYIFLVLVCCSKKNLATLPRKPCRGIESDDL
jgi:hypothetical protein